VKIKIKNIKQLRKFERKPEKSLPASNSVKLADKPGFVDLIAKADSHSSRRTITCTLKLSTRWQRESRLIYFRKNASLFDIAADGGYRVSP